MRSHSGRQMGTGAAYYYARQAQRRKLTGQPYHSNATNGERERYVYKRRVTIQEGSTKFRALGHQNEWRRGGHECATSPGSAKVREGASGPKGAV